MSSPQWVLDPLRGEQYWYSESEACFVYQSGERVYLNSAGASGATQVSTNTGTQGVHGGYGGTDVTDPQEGAVTPTHNGAFSDSNSSAMLSSGSYPNPEQRQHNASQAHMQAPTGSSSQTGEPAFNAEWGPPDAITDPDLLQMNVYAVMMLKGSFGDVEPLDPRELMKSEGATIPLIEVFKVLWAENAGDDQGSVAVLSQGRFANERFHVKIRWLAVIRESGNYCSCVPIQTYSQRGVAKPGVENMHHAVIHTGREPPNPRREEVGMLSPAVRVKPRDRTGKLGVMSRINFGKVYTVEHNVKVFDFGVVHDDSMAAFSNHFRSVWQL